MPADQIPSMGKYLREHSMNQIALRLFNGGRTVISNLRHSFGYFNYIALYISLLFISGMIYWRKSRDFLLKFPFQWLFILAYFGLYFLLYAWYVPITSGARLILSQLIPLLFIISVGLQALLGNSTIKLKGRSINLLALISLPITGAMIFTIYAIFVSRIGAMYGGH